MFSHAAATPWELIQLNKKGLFAVIEIIKGWEHLAKGGEKRLTKKGRKGEEIVIKI